MTLIPSVVTTGCCSDHPPGPAPPDCCRSAGWAAGVLGGVVARWGRGDQEPVTALLKVDGLLPARASGAAIARDRLAGKGDRGRRVRPVHRDEYQGDGRIARRSVALGELRGAELAAQRA